MIDIIKRLRAAKPQWYSSPGKPARERVLISAADRDAVCAEVEAEQRRSAMYADLVRRTAEAMGLTPADGWDKLPEKVEALRADAERYRWARDVAEIFQYLPHWTCRTAAEVDAEVDAAMRA